MRNYDCIFLDRDGTLNHDTGYIADLSKFNFYPFTISALIHMSKKGNKFCIITNQSGVDRGLIQIGKLDEIHEYIRYEFEKNEIALLDIYVCPDHPNKASNRRKPGTGMFLEAAEQYNLSLNNCLMVGDSVDDMLAGMKLGMETMLVLTGRGKKSLSKLGANHKPTYVKKNISEGFEQLCL